MNDLLSATIGSVIQASRTQKQFAIVKLNKISRKVLTLLYKEGFIVGFNVDYTNPQIAVVYLKYMMGLEPMLQQGKLFSKKSRRVYITYNKVYTESIKRPNWNFVISTKEGLLTFRKLIVENKKLGGEAVMGFG